MLLAIRVLVCIVAYGACGHLLRSESLILGTEASSVGMSENILVVDCPFDCVACPSRLQRIHALWRKDAEGIEIRSNFSRGYGCLACVGGLQCRSEAAYAAKRVSIDVHVNMKSRAGARIFKDYCSNQRGIRCNWNAVSVPGSGGNDWDIRDQNPSSLTSLEGLATLLNANKEYDQACECDDSAQNRDVIQAVSCTKLRTTTFSFLGILLVFFGRRLLTYGERLRNPHCDISWWSGYAISTLGGTILALVLMGLAAQLVFP